VNSLERLVGILDEFEGADSLLTTEQLHDRLGLTRSTLYRYLKVLTDAGLLASFHGIGYSLGPRVIELDYRIRMHDPLLAASRPLMRALAQEYEGIVLLCRRFQDRVLCVHQEASTEAFRSRYERGQLRSLFHGAASRVILAHLPAPRLRRLYAAQSEEFARTGTGKSLAEARAILRSIRQAGFTVSHGQVTPGLTGVGAPVFDGGGCILGSICLVVEAEDLPRGLAAGMGERVKSAAAGISAALAPSA